MTSVRVLKYSIKTWVCLCEHIAHCIHPNTSFVSLKGLSDFKDSCMDVCKCVPVCSNEKNKDIIV